MFKIGQNWGKIANYPPQRSTKICTPATYTVQLAILGRVVNQKLIVKEELRGLVVMKGVELIFLLLSKNVPKK